jgi:ankyrin repeat protein
MDRLMLMDSLISLSEAISRGDIADVRRRLNEGIPVNSTLMHVYPPVTLLMYAAGSRQPSIVKLLLQRGADINKQTDDEGSTALMFAVISNNSDVFQELLRAGPDLSLENRHGWNVLFKVIRDPLSTYPELLDMLLAPDIDLNINARNRHGGLTALHVAVLYHNLRAIIKLRQRGIDLDIRDDEGKTAKDLAEPGSNEERLLTMPVDQLASRLALIESGVIEYLNNSNSNSNSNSNYYNIPNIGKLNIPTGTRNTVTYEYIAEDDDMVNFQGEHGFGRFYKRSTFNRLPVNNNSNKKKNPITRQRINRNQTLRSYKAHLVGGSRRRNPLHARTRTCKRKCKSTKRRPI